MVHPPKPSSRNSRPRGPDTKNVVFTLEMTYRMSMLRRDGPYFTATIKALRLPEDEEKDARRNAENIISQVINAYETNIAPGHVGATGTGIPQDFSASAHLHGLTGLVYGRIQSGKTRAMIASTALAFDNGFRVVVVLTSNINDLVEQTHFDFAAGLPDAMVYTKDNQMNVSVTSRAVVRSSLIAQI